MKSEEKIFVFLEKQNYKPQTFKKDRLKFMKIKTVMLGKQTGKSDDRKYLQNMADKGLFLDKKNF